MMIMKHVGARRPWSWALLSGAGALCMVQESEACSPPDPGPGYYDLGAEEPRDGADGVALDSSVVIDLNYVKSGRDMTVTVELSNADTGEVVDGEVVQGYWGSSQVRFYPTADLLPNTTYSVTARTTSRIERPSEASGVEELNTTFTTGTESLPALEIVGELGVELEDYQRDYHAPCDGTCSCPKTGIATDTRARLSLPGGRGGQKNHGYSVNVRATRDDGDTVNVESTLVEEEAGTLLELGHLREEAAYLPCFEVTLSDASQKLVDGQTVCLDAEIPALDTGKADPGSDAGAPRQHDVPTRGDGGEPPAAGGCSLLRRTGQGSAEAGLVLLTLFVASARGRRRLR